MKTSATKPLLLGCLGLTFGTMLSSCVDPYAAYYGPSHRVSGYNPGYQVRVLPSGYRSETIDGNRYYNHNGTYYQSRSGGYVVVEAPHNRYESTRPRYNDSYSRSRNDDSYSRPRYNDSYSRGDSPYERREVIISSLPRGYRVVTYQNRRYYQHKDVYYQQSGSGYVIVSRPY